MVVLILATTMTEKRRRIRVRAKITSLGRDKLIITELPYTKLLQL